MKFKWGGQDLEQRLEDWEDKRNRPYEGPRPPRGMYPWLVTEVWTGESTNGFPQLRVLVTMDTSQRSDIAKYNGFKMSDRIIVKQDGSTDFRIRPFLDALGISIRDFVNNTEVDPASERDDRNGNKEFRVKSIGKRRFDRGPVSISGLIAPQKSDPNYFDISFYPPKDSDADEAQGSDDDADTGDAPDEPQEERPAQASGRRGSAARGRAGSTGRRETPF